MTNLLSAAAACLVLATPGDAWRDIAGAVPETLHGASRVVWIPASVSNRDASCTLRTPAEWACRDVPPSEIGVVAIVGSEAVAYEVIGDRPSTGGAAVAAWGRVIRVIPGGVVAEALQDLHVTAWKPVRPNTRRQAQRFIPGEDTAVGVVRLSEVAFWVAGTVADPDAFLRVEGPAVATTRISTAVLAEGPPELPLFVAMSQPVSLFGQIQAGHAEAADGAEVELLEPLDFRDESENDGDVSFIRRGRTRAGTDGSFVFEKLEPGVYQIAASHQAYGRGTARVDRLSEPVVVRLTDSGRVSGRVLQRGLPVAAARVRFVPDTSAWTASVDPGDHLVNDVYTIADGRFTLTLPVRRAGFVQVTAPDGAMVRLPAPSSDSRDASFGDVTLPTLMHVTLRLLEGPPDCALFAIGPLGRLGLSVVSAWGSWGVYDLSLPEPGDWSISAECAGRAAVVAPPFVSIGPDGIDRVLDIRIERPQSSEPVRK